MPSSARVSAGEGTCRHKRTGLCGQTPSSAQPLLLEGAKIDCPYAYRASATFKRAPKAKEPKAKTKEMELED